MFSHLFSLPFYSSCFLSCDAYRLSFLSSFSFVSLPFYLSCDVFPFSSFLVLLLFALFQPQGCYLLLLPSALLFDLLLHFCKMVCKMFDGVDVVEIVVGLPM